jgi:hypothetical protein
LSFHIRQAFSWQFNYRHRVSFWKLREPIGYHREKNQMKMLEKLCLWYLKKYWNSKGYKKAYTLEQQKQTENVPQFMKTGQTK